MLDQRGVSRPGLVVGIVAALLIAGASYYLFLRTRSEIPSLSQADSGPDGEGAKVDIAQGPIAWRARGAQAQNAIKPGDRFAVGAQFSLKNGSTLQVMTVGNWLLVLDGEGEFVFDDARRDPDRKAHTGIWTMTKGTIRAKPHDYDPADHWLEIRTPKAKIYVHQGEVGARISEGGSGSVWLVKGQAEVVWEDGRRKKLEPNNTMEYL
jgi:hypothetical protein